MSAVQRILLRKQAASSSSLLFLSTRPSSSVQVGRVGLHRNIRNITRESGIASGYSTTSSNRSIATLTSSPSSTSLLSSTTSPTLCIASRTGPLLSSKSFFSSSSSSTAATSSISDHISPSSRAAMEVDHSTNSDGAKLIDGTAIAKWVVFTRLY